MWLYVRCLSETGSHQFLVVEGTGKLIDQTIAQYKATILRDLEPHPAICDKVKDAMSQQRQVTGAGQSTMGVSVFRRSQGWPSR